MADPTLKDSTDQALMSLIQTATDAANFLKGELPAAVSELLTYYTVARSVETVLALIVCAGAVWLWVTCNRNYAGERDKPWYCRNWDLPSFFAILPVVPGVIWFTCSLLGLLKIILAPRI
jgi:hypothetical protein